ncbi:hypothetical protein GF354_03085 [Candidatus Peregrinibacteria bacterium]|nr:hypothetical protein [Candidatus Peregrinibacteria bacterium]
MKKFKILSIAMMLVVLVGLNGCSLGLKGDGPDKEPKEVLKEAISNSVENTKSSEYEFSMDADLDGPEGESPENIKFKFNLSGELDHTDLTKPKLTMKVDGTGNWDNGEMQELMGELRLDGEYLYFIVEKITDFEGQFPTSMYEPYLAKWWKMAIPEGTFSEENVLAPQNKELKQLVKGTDFFKNAKYAGIGDVKGEEVYKYEVTLDRQAVVTFLVESAKISTGEDASESEINELREALETIEISGVFYVSTADMTSRGMDGVLELEVKDGANGTVDFSMYSWNHNKDVVIEVPEGAEEFDPMMFLFGGAMDPSMMEDMEAPMDPSMMEDMEAPMDPSMMEDMEDMQLNVEM